MSLIFKTFKEKFKDYLTFNYAERRGIMVLVVLIMLTESVSALLPSYLKQDVVDMSNFEDDVRRFDSVLMLPDTLVEKLTNNDQQKKQYPKQPTYKKKAFAERPPVMIEINTADSAQLVQLYGIGPAFANRILKYRGMLGGFFSSEQLLEVYGMDSIRYLGIVQNIIVDKSSILRINVNEAEFKTLLHHPYLDYETVKLICNYREYTGPITCSDSLRVVIAYDPMWKKVRHYVEYRVSDIE